MSFVSVVCCQVQVSASSRSLDQRSPTEFDVSECDGEVWSTRRPCPTGGSGAMTEVHYKLFNAVVFKFLKISNPHHRYLAVILLPLDGALV
jgi:hypothetical protein